MSPMVRRKRSYLMIICNVYFTIFDKIIILNIYIYIDIYHGIMIGFARALIKIYSDVDPKNDFPSI
jgi:hypothetical protein